MNDIVYILAGVGVIFLICFLILLLSIIIEVVKDFISKKIYAYKRKRRFNRPPTAKCYCVDCQFRDLGNVCTAGNVCGYKVADDWFCWKGQPRTKKGD